MDVTRLPPLSEQERRARLRLSRTEQVGPITFRRLIEQYGSASAALAALPELARRGGRRSRLAVCSAAEAERELAEIERIGARLIVWGEPDYPPPLAAIEDAPPVLIVLGDLALFARPALALVGSRNASVNGRRFAEQLAGDLGQAGFVIVSGLARGIDTAAHRGALASGTIAVVAGGVDVVYPPENEGLHRLIAAEGAIISECRPGVQPQSRHFPPRNRIIAGLSRGVVVIEASLRSGSLITARMALEQGREVFAVPGSPLDPRARGGNDLIRQGAALTESVHDVLTVLGTARAVGGRPMADPESTAEMTALLAPDDPLPDRVRHILEEALSPEPVSVDEIIRSCQLSYAVVTTLLLELELAGRIERHPGNRVSRIIPAHERA